MCKFCKRLYSLLVEYIVAVLVYRIDLQKEKYTKRGENFYLRATEIPKVIQDEKNSKTLDYIILGNLCKQ